MRATLSKYWQISNILRISLQILCTLSCLFFFFLKKLQHFQIESEKETKTLKVKLNEQQQKIDELQHQLKLQHKQFQDQSKQQQDQVN